MGTRERLKDKSKLECAGSARQLWIASCALPVIGSERRRAWRVCRCERKQLTVRCCGISPGLGLGVGSQDAEQLSQGAWTRASLGRRGRGGLSSRAIHEGRRELRLGTARTGDPSQHLQVPGFLFRPALRGCDRHQPARRLPPSRNVGVGALRDSDLGYHVHRSGRRDCRDRGHRCGAAGVERLRGRVSTYRCSYFSLRGHPFLRRLPLARPGDQTRGPAVYALHPDGDGFDSPRVEWTSIRLLPGPELFSDPAAVLFMVALVGWMPSAFDISIWHSLWTLARRQQTKYAATVKEALLDFNIGYLGTALMAVCFVALGARVSCTIPEQSFRNPPPASPIR